MGKRETNQSARRRDLAARYEQIRGLSRALVEPLEIEDLVVQSMPDVSPTKWHLAHTTWFFETFLLARRADHVPFDERYEVLFNSYYNTVGEQFPRHRRGLVTRPTVSQVMRYREAVDEQMIAWLERSSQALSEELLDLLEVGLHHEQQHQELLLTDIKHVLSCSPFGPIYCPEERAEASPERGVDPLKFVTFEGGIFKIGHDAEQAPRPFCFDNELPRHRALLEPFALADRLVTVGDYLEFMEDGGYQRHDLWLSEGWHAVQTGGPELRRPLYWEDLKARGGEPWSYTLAGTRRLRFDEPVTHISLFEADAYARWAGARLPSEQELEVATRAQEPEGPSREANFVHSRRFHPAPAPSKRPEGAIAQLYGDGWEWTRSDYSPYPGFVSAPGALGEYNGKFMCNQYVLRGGSCASSRDHLRPTYRNFFPSSARWQFTAIRLAKDV